MAEDLPLQKHTALPKRRRLRFLLACTVSALLGATVSLSVHHWQSKAETLHCEEPTCAPTFIHSTILRSAIDEWTAGGANGFTRSARIVPSIRSGQPNGFKIYAIDARSPLAALGIRNGDTIHSIDGFDISSPDLALDAYTRLRDNNDFAVELTRAGCPVSMTVTIY